MRHPGTVGPLPSGNKPVSLELVGDSPDLGINISNLCHVGLGPSPVLRVRRYGPRFTLHGPRPGRLAPMHSAPVPSGDDGVLAGRAFTGFCEAPLAWPMGPEPRTRTRINELFSVS